MCSLIHDGVLTCAEQRVRELRKQGVGGVEEMLAIKLGR